MQSTHISYLCDNEHPDAGLRLKALEAIEDRRSISLLRELADLEGLFCLEIGAGAGSIAEWMVSQVGQSGCVTATDIAGTLVNLIAGGNNPDNAGNSLHCRARYFDPTNERAGLPNDVAALVRKITKDGIELTLVNTNPSESRSVVLQAGAYREHRCTEAAMGDKKISVDDRLLAIEIAPGSGSRITIDMDLYANDPSLAHPW